MRAAQKHRTSLAYPYEKYTYQNFNFNTQAGDYIGQQEINPFEATHSCCFGTAGNPSGWRLVDKNDAPCFIDPEPGCYGRVFREDGTPYTGLEGQKGLVLEQQQRFCTGERGNMCDGDFKNELYNGKLWCGENGKFGCGNDIESRCENGLAFSIIKGQGWCSGALGCGNLCETEIAYTGKEIYLTFSSEQINEQATQLKVDDFEEIPTSISSADAPAKPREDRATLISMESSMAYVKTMPAKVIVKCNTIKSG